MSRREQGVCRVVFALKLAILRVWESRPFVGGGGVLYSCMKFTEDRKNQMTLTKYGL